jgi:pimeloyl-ACP methyl ester carboxylesterase
LVPGPDGSLATWEWGDQGPRVLLVHGWQGRGAQLGSFVDPLLSRGFRVVTFDAPAHGASPGTRSSLVHFARAIESVAAATGPLHAAVAHSMGSPSLTWAFRNGALAQRVVFIAPPVDVDDFTRHMASLLNLGPDVVRATQRRLERRLGASTAELHMQRLAPRMRVPLLVFHDEDDRDVPLRCGELVANAWPGAELVRTQGLGHHRILRDRAVLERAVEFLVQGQGGLLG